MGEYRNIRTLFVFSLILLGLFFSIYALSFNKIEVLELGKLTFEYNETYIPEIDPEKLLELDPTSEEYFNLITQQPVTRVVQEYIDIRTPKIHYEPEIVDGVTRGGYEREIDGTIVFLHGEGIEPPSVCPT